MTSNIDKIVKESSQDDKIIPIIFDKSGVEHDCLVFALARLKDCQDTIAVAMIESAMNGENHVVIKGVKNA
jgi:hypothetical protein